MVNLDRFVALFILVFFSFYTYLSFNFDLLPFERLQVFKPNTTPQAIGILGILIACFVLVRADGEINKDNEDCKNYEWKQLISIIVSLSLYAFLIKPLGFVASTALFLIVGGFILGERSFVKLPIIAIISAVIIWLLVDKLLGIYLSPFPSFLN